MLEKLLEWVRLTCLSMVPPGSQEDLSPRRLILGNVTRSSTASRLHMTVDWAFVSQIDSERPNATW